MCALVVYHHATSKCKSLYFRGKLYSSVKYAMHALRRRGKLSAGLLEVDSLVKIQSLGSLSGVNMLACKHYLLYPSLWVLHNGLMNWVSETSLPMETIDDCHVHHHI